jgi:hypothetical protein
MNNYLYRAFIQTNKLELVFDGRLLIYTTPKFLNAPLINSSNTESVLWKKEFDIPLDGKASVKGFVGLLETMSTNHSGFALFRRGRVVQGSADEGFKPKDIMGDAGSFEYKRFFGEFHMDGFEVSFTKKGIKWDTNMDLFLELLKDDLVANNFIKQAKEYRVRPTQLEIQRNALKVLESTVEDFKENVGEVLENIRSSEIGEDKLDLSKASDIQHREFIIEFNDTDWSVTIELSHDDSISDWLEVGSNLIPNRAYKKDFTQLDIRMSMNHPFVTHFAGSDKSKLEPILRLAVAIGLAEQAARDADVKKIGLLRVNLNKILKSMSNYK